MGGEKGKVMVFARCRPSVDREFGERDCVRMDADTKTVHLDMDDGDAIDRVLSGGSTAPKTVNKNFTFDGVFDGSSQQKDVFDLVGKPVLRDVLQGYNGSILAYGQTGAGKTHSLLNAGGRDGSDPAQAGLLPRVVAALFVHIGSDMANSYTVEAAMMQVYNEQVDDLLVEDTSNNKGQNLTVSAGSMVKGLTWVTCPGPDQLLDCFTRGRNNIVYAETKMNKASSRSHAMFQIKVTKRPRATGSAKTAVQMKATFGKLTVVDLAGSERVKKSGVSGQQLKEAANINGSLLAFGNVVSALAEKKKFIPYRDSKLTRILEDSVGGNCKTSLLVCCSPASDSADETLSTLEFASRAACIEIEASVNEGTITVDAAKLAADLAGDGLSDAVKEKHKELKMLEGKLADTIRASQAELELAKAEAKKVSDAESKKAGEKDKLISKWRTKAEEEGKRAAEAEKVLKARVAELEAKVTEAKEASEVRAALAAAQREAKDSILEAQRKAAVFEKELVAARAQASDNLAQASKLASAELQAVQERAAEEAKLAEEREARLQDRLDASEKALLEANTTHEADQNTIEELQREVAAVEARRASEKVAAEKRVNEARREAAEALERLEATKVEGVKAMQTAEAKHSAELETLRAEALSREKAASVKHEEIVSDLQAQLAQGKEQSVALEKHLERRAEEIRTLETKRASLEESLADSQSALESKGRELEAALKRLSAEALAASESKKLALRKAEEDKLEAVEAAVLHGETQVKRVGWAFSAARALLDREKIALSEEYVTLKARFDARESRAEDLANIAKLEGDLKKTAKTLMEQAEHSKQLQLQLDNRNLNDAVFGKETQINTKAPGMPKATIKKAAPQIKPGVPTRVTAAQHLGTTGPKTSTGGSGRGLRF